MKVRWLHDVEIDFCAECEGIYLDAGEAEAHGAETEPLFSDSRTRSLGPSQRLCPAHGKPMVTYAIAGLAGELQIERSECCGGIFLDAGEEESLGRMARVIAEQVWDREQREETRVQSTNGKFDLPPPTDPVEELRGKSGRGFFDGILDMLVHRRVNKSRARRVGFDDDGLFG